MSSEQVVASEMKPLDLAQVWTSGRTFEQFLSQASPEHAALWEGIYHHARAPEWAVTALQGRSLRLLAIVEDWCIDTFSTIPFLARVAESVPNAELRLVLRDQNLAVMDRYLTAGARAIPVVIALDEQYRELGHWGPRPSELQAWVRASKDIVPRAERAREERRWYARDKGETTVREVLEAAGVRTSGPS
jgi:hypothetical protein